MGWCIGAPIHCGTMQLSFFKVCGSLSYLVCALQGQGWLIINQFIRSLVIKSGFEKSGFLTGDQSINVGFAHPWLIIITGPAQCCVLARASDSSSSLETPFHAGSSSGGWVPRRWLRAGGQRPTVDQPLAVRLPPVAPTSLQWSLPLGPWQGTKRARLASGGVGAQIPPADRSYGCDCKRFARGHHGQFDYCCCFLNVVGDCAG